MLLRDVAFKVLRLRACVGFDVLPCEFVSVTATEGTHSSCSMDFCYAQSMAGQLVLKVREVVYHGEIVDLVEPVAATSTIFLHAD